MKNTLKIANMIANIVLWIITTPFIVLLSPLVFISWLFVVITEGVRHRLMQVPLINEIISDSDY